jgi:NAD+ diphosphatase
MLDSQIEAEIDELAEQYGAPQRVVIELKGQPFSPLILDDRYGEVCMVIRRPNGKLLTAIKTFYPPSAFRLLTGGVDHGESIAAALRRETHEETGLDVVVRRFLAVVEYRLPTLLDGPFATFAFLLDETGGTLDAQDPGEQIGAFREVAVAELPALAATLEQAPDSFDPQIEGNWRDWGRFRAIIHRVVYEALNETPRMEDRGWRMEDGAIA